MTNAEMVAACRAGDPAAFEAMYAAHGQAIQDFCYRLMGDRDDAFDMAQDAFVKAHKALTRLEENTNLSAWLHTIARRRCLDELRRRQVIRFRSIHVNTDDEPDPMRNFHDESAEDAALSLDEARRVRVALDMIDEPGRTALLLRESKGLACAEIGEVQGIGRQAVKSRLHRARQKLREAYVEMERQEVSRERIEA